LKEITIPSKRKFFNSIIPVYTAVFILGCFYTVLFVGLPGSDIGTKYESLNVYLVFQYIFLIIILICSMHNSIRTRILDHLPTEVITLIFFILYLGILVAGLKIAFMIPYFLIYQFIIFAIIYGIVLISDHFEHKKHEIYLGRRFRNYNPEN